MSRSAAVSWLLLAAACGRGDAGDASAAGDGPCCAAAPAPAGLSSASLYHLGSSWHDQTGAERKLADFRGRVQVVAMIFTRCQYACPRTLADLRAIDAALPAGLRDAAHWLLVSFDDVRDTPAALREYSLREGLDPSRWTLLHGSASAVRELAAALGVSYARDANGDFSHGNAITVLDRAGAIAHQSRGLGADATATAAAIARVLE